MEYVLLFAFAAIYALIDGYVQPMISASQNPYVLKLGASSKGKLALRAATVFALLVVVAFVFAQVDKPISVGGSNVA